MDWQIVSALVKTVELKDQCTAAHTWRVALYAQALAEAAATPREDIRRIMNASVLHDIGKIDIPQAILAKPGRLDEREIKIIQQHTILGEERLRRMGERDPLILSLVRWHHERLDGSGYPDGLAGDAIPLAPRFFAVIDSFDAMTSLRPYRHATGPEAASHAIAELKALSGRWYCPRCVQHFCDLYESGDLDWILEYFNDEQSLGALAAGPHVDAIIEVRKHLLDGGPGAAQTLQTVPGPASVRRG